MGQKDKEATDAVADETTSSGEFVFPNNDRYKGDYIINEEGVIERRGQGTHKTSKGITYTGTWENDKMNGSGRLIFPSGAEYEGGFANNHYDGEGVYRWPNGCVYKGSFCGSKLKGEGVFSDTHGQTWTGQFNCNSAPGLKFKLNL